MWEKSIVINSQCGRGGFGIRAKKLRALNRNPLSSDTKPKLQGA